MPDETSQPASSQDDEPLQEPVACALALTDPRGLIVKANKTFCRWIGRDCADVVGSLRFQDLLTMGGKIFHQTHWLPLLQMQGSIAEVKLEIVHTDGRAIPMIMNAVARKHAGSVFYELALFVAEDRHRYEDELLRAKTRAEELLVQLRERERELKRAQTRLEMALSSADLTVWESGIAGDERKFDAQVGRLLGLPPGAIVSPEEFLKAIEPDDLARVLAIFQAPQLFSSPNYEGGFTLVGIDGRRRTIRVTGAKIFDESGNPVELVGVLQDISDSVARRAAAEDRALFAEQMVGIVSHDLRNPLAAIHLGAHLLAKTSTDSTQQQAVSRIKHSVARANRLIGDLLDFTQARIGRGLSVRLQPLNLHELIANSLTELAAAYPDRELRHVEEGIGPSLGDGDRLTQLLGNLVSNAVAYGAKDKPITITSRLGSDCYCIEVHNEGTPIPAGILPSLFAPMTRGLDVKTENKSVGLGLFIVKEIATAHSGEVRVESSAQSGTRFSLIVPTNSD